MKMDRELQRHILHELADGYPEWVSTGDMESIAGEYRQAVPNMCYLEEHQLVRLKSDNTGGTDVLAARITNKGLDFLADDGGLSAVLGVITIKYHQDTLRQMMELHMAKADIPEHERSLALQKLRELPADSIKHLATRLMDLGLENAPRALQLIQNWLA